MNLVSNGLEKFLAEILKINPFFHSAKVVQTVPLDKETSREAVLDEFGNYAGASDAKQNFIYLVLPKDYRFSPAREQISSCGTLYEVSAQFKLVAVAWDVCPEPVAFRMAESITLAESSLNLPNALVRIGNLVVDRQQVVKEELGENFALPDKMQLISVGASVSFDWAYDYCREINLCSNGDT